MMTIRDLRLAAKMRQSDVAVAVGVDPLTVTMWERGRRPSAVHLLALARFFGVPAERIELGPGLSRKRRTPAATAEEP